MCILSGSFGDGHEVAARELQRRLADRGVDAVVLDIVERYPWRLGRALKRVYLWQVKAVPVTWRWFLAWLAPSKAGRGLGRRIALATIGSATRRLRALPSMYDAVISTHPFASQVIGRLHDQGHLGDMSTFTYLTDLSVHPLWVHPSIHTHLALHEVAALEARSHGARSTRVVEPVVRALGQDRPRTPGAVAALREEFGLPEVGRLVAVTGGAEGVGDLEATARDLLAIPGVVPVVLCGRNTVLRERLSAIPGVRALGWVSDMGALYAAVDLVVQNAGGSTSLEALAAGVPIVSYRCLPGHGEANAANLARSGLIPWLYDSLTLAEAVTSTDGAHRSRQRPTAPGAAEVIIATLGGSNERMVG